MRQDSRHYLTINIAKSNILQYWLIHSSLHCPMITLHVSWQSDQWNTRVLEKWKQLSLIKSKVNIQNTLSSLIFGPYIYASAQLLPLCPASVLPLIHTSFVRLLADSNLHVSKGFVYLAVSFKGFGEYCHKAAPALLAVCSGSFSWRKEDLCSCQRLRVLRSGLSSRIALYLALFNLTPVACQSCE